MCSPKWYRTYRPKLGCQNASGLSLPESQPLSRYRYHRRLRFFVSRIFALWLAKLLVLYNCKCMKLNHHIQMLPDGAAKILRSYAQPLLLSLLSTRFLYTMGFQHYHMILVLLVNKSKYRPQNTYQMLDTASILQILNTVRRVDLSIRLHPIESHSWFICMQVGRKLAA